MAEHNLAQILDTLKWVGVLKENNKGITMSEEGPQIPKPAPLAAPEPPKQDTEFIRKQQEQADLEFEKKALEKGFVKKDWVDIKTEKGLTLKTQVSIFAVIALIASFVWYMSTVGLINWWVITDGVKTFNYDDAGVKCVAWLLFWTGCLAFGIKKDSIQSLGLAIMQIWNDRNTTSEQKLALIMQQVEAWLGWIADISQLLTIKPPKIK
jgi:hypothetical protein